MQYNHYLDVVLSVDNKGMFEYWEAEVSGSHLFPESKLSFKYKSETDLYEFPKTKSLPVSLTISNNGQFFACMGSDSQVSSENIFTKSSGKSI